MKKMKFEMKIIFSAIIINAVSLIISYTIFAEDKINADNERIQTALRNTAALIENDDYIKEKLYDKANDGYIQNYTKKVISQIDDVDLIVIADMDEVKYSHLNENQIGEKYVNPDDEDVILYGKSYNSVMVGSVGKTLRWFQPIMYKGKQIGFVMVAKYYNNVVSVRHKTRLKYFFLFLMTLIITIIFAKVFARNTKKSILNMEPEEISTIYSQMDIILSNTQNAIISFDKNNNVMQINNMCYEMFDNFDASEILNMVEKYISAGESFTMKELRVMNKKVFITLKPVTQGNQFLGNVLVISDGDNIRKVAKEITGIDEVVKGLRASVHEFKNNLHVILGLIQLGEYDQAQDYIMKLQKVQEDNSREFMEIHDYFVRALLISRKIIAKERNITFSMSKESCLYEEHGIIESEDIVTILGNLLENAYESCVQSNNYEKRVDVTLKENEKEIMIVVSDNGTPFELDKNDMLKEGKSSKGENRGTGLYLVKNRVDLFNGSIDISENNGVKIFKICLYK